MEATPTQPVPEFSLPQRIWGALAAPRVVFQSLTAHPRFLGVLLLITGVNLAATLLVGDVILQTELDKMSDRGATEEMMATQERNMRIGMPVAAVIFTPISFAVFAGIFLFLSNVILGGGITFRHAMAAVSHAQIVTIPAVLVRVPLMLVTQDQVRTSLAVLLPGDVSEGFLFHFLNQFDIFSIWSLILGVIALSAMARTTTGRAGAAVGTVWVVLVTAIAGLGSVFQSLGGS